MRVAIDVKSVALHHTGIAVYTKNLVRILARQGGAHRFILIGPAAALEHVGNAAHFEKSALELRPYAGPLRICLYDQVALARRARSLAADVLVTPNCDAPIASPLPMLVVAHDIAYLRFPQWYSPAYRAYYGGLLKWHLGHASAVITDSEFSRSEIAAIAPRHRPVHVVPSALEDAFFDEDLSPPSGGDVVSRLPENYILYTGGADPRKDLAVLWDAFVSAKRRLGHDVSLVVTGSPSEFVELLQSAERSGLLNRVCMLGRVSRDVMPAVYRRARTVVYTSRYEGFGLPVLESLASGTPVVTTRVGIASELDRELLAVVSAGDVDALSAAIVQAIASCNGDIVQRRRTAAREIVDRVWPAFEAALAAVETGDPRITHVRKGTTVVAG